MCLGTMLCGFEINNIGNQPTIRSAISVPPCPFFSALVRGRTSHLSRPSQPDASGLSRSNHCAVEHIGALYEIEKEIRGRPPDERRKVRNTRSRPLLNSMHAWLETFLSKLSRKSDTSATIHYALGCWAAFVRYCDDGRIEIDNSAVERALRAIAVGRRNCLFAGSDARGKRAATFYCLLGTAKLNGLDPEAYLRAVLTCIADHPVNRIADLLPWNLALNDPATELATR